MTLSNKDKVRLLVGDTDTGDQILSDSEINDFIAIRSTVDATTGGTTAVNIPAAGADAAGAIAAKYARHFNFAEDNQRFDRAQRVSHYLALAKELRRRSGGYSVPMHGTTST